MNQSIHYLIMFSFLYASLKIDKPKIHRKKKRKKKKIGSPAFYPLTISIKNKVETKQITVSLVICQQL